MKKEENPTARTPPELCREISLASQVSQGKWPLPPWTSILKSEAGPLGVCVGQKGYFSPASPRGEDRVAQPTGHVKHSGLGVNDLSLGGYTQRDSS